MANSLKKHRLFGWQCVLLCIDAKILKEAVVNMWVVNNCNNIDHNIDMCSVEQKVRKRSRCFTA